MNQIFETFSELAEAFQSNEDRRNDRQDAEHSNALSGEGNAQTEPSHERESLFERITDLLGE